MAESIRIHMDQTRIRAMLRSAGGPVQRKVLEKGKQIEVRARELAGKHGTMGQYVHSVPTSTPKGTTFVVYCDHPAAIYVLKGTKPHAIDSHGTWPLRNKATGQVFGQHVWHPGYKGDDFLGRAMREAGPL